MISNTIIYCHKALWRQLNTKVCGRFFLFFLQRKYLKNASWVYWKHLLCYTSRVYWKYLLCYTSRVYWKQLSDSCLQKCSLVQWPVSCLHLRVRGQSTWLLTQSWMYASTIRAWLQSWQWISTTTHWYKNMSRPALAFTISRFLACPTLVHRRVEVFNL